MYINTLEHKASNKLSDIIIAGIQARERKAAVMKDPNINLKTV